MQIASRQCFRRKTVRSAGTVIVVRASAASMTVKIAEGICAAGSEEVTVDWGDGTVESHKSLIRKTHTYSRARDYTIRISDDLRTFAYTTWGSGQDQYRDMLIELVRMGSKVQSISSYGFNNCHNMRGVINLPGVTMIGSYAFGSTLGITDFILPSMTWLSDTSFYRGPSPTQIHADNVKSIEEMFFRNYGRHLQDIYLRGSTTAQIKAMPDFPFWANASVRFHGSDGIVLGDGTVIN